MTVPQETRGFDEHRFETYKLRSKEDAPDYRYMPDPNLGILVLSDVRFLGHFLKRLVQKISSEPYTKHSR